MYTTKVRVAADAGAGARLPEVRFAIVGNPRTGTSHLASLLDSHRDIACWDDEIFDAGQAFDVSCCDSPAEFLRTHVLPVRAHAVGFKLLWDAFDRRDSVLEALRSLEFALLHVYRENFLDSFISFQLATINRAFTSWYSDYKVTRFTADYEECLEWFELTELRDATIRQRIREWRLAALEIEYRELCASQDTILDFLQMPRQRLASQLRKQREGTQLEAIINYDEVRERFSDSRWAPFFEA